MRLMAFALLLGATAACGLTDPNDLDIDVALQQPQTLAPVWVHFTVTNNDDETAMLEQCNDRIVPYVDKTANGEWGELSSALCPSSVPQVSRELLPGQSTVDSVRVESFGQYRLRVPYSHESGSNRVVRLATSNAVMVE